MKALDPRSRARSLSVDVLIAAALAALALLLLGLAAGTGGIASDRLAPAAVTALAATLPLAFRRSHPGLTVMAVAIAYAAYISLEVSQITAPSMAVLIAIYSAGAHRAEADGPTAAARRLTVSGLIAFVVVHLLGAATALGPSLPLYLIASVTLNGFLYAGAWLMGDWHRQRDLYEAELDERARELERNRLGRERAVVAEERVRIARELHDVVAHHVSLMGVSAGAARMVLSESPAKAVALLNSIEHDSRAAVDEMSWLLGALRSEPERTASDRASRLASAGSLADVARRAGIKTQLVVVGTAAQPLPQSLDLSAYRILQESVTNVIRHSGATAMVMKIIYEPNAVFVSVDDDGDRSPRTVDRAGRGLIGMRERAALFGGSIEAGRRPEGGFRVAARLPVKR